MQAIVEIFLEYYVLPLFVTFAFSLLKGMVKDKNLDGNEILNEVYRELCVSLVFCLLFFSLGLHAHREKEHIDLLSDYLPISFTVTTILLLLTITTYTYSVRINISSDDKVKGYRINFVVNAFILNIMLTYGIFTTNFSSPFTSLVTKPNGHYNNSKIIILVVVIFCFSILSDKLLYTIIARLLFNKSIIDLQIGARFFESYLHDENVQNNERINYLESLASKYGSQSIAMKDVYISLAELYENRGLAYSQRTLECYDLAIALLKDNKFSSDENFVIMATIRKIRYVKKNNVDCDIKKMLEELCNAYPNSQYLKRKFKKEQLDFDCSTNSSN